MKLEVGMYARTDKGKIGKIIKTEKGIGDLLYVLDTDLPNYAHIKEEFIKASHNIIDLIEVGDYVNGEKVTSIIPPDILGDEELDYAHISSLNGEPLYEDIEIKSIVTKEQFESMSYEVSE